MTEDKNKDGPENCHNCGSENLVGPFKFAGAWVYITFFTSIPQQVFICVDCGHTMFFTEEGHEHKVIREAERQETQDR